MLAISRSYTLPIYVLSHGLASYVEVAVRYARYEHIYSLDLRTASACRFPASRVSCLATRMVV
jgi:hypothetical protein